MVTKADFLKNSEKYLKKILFKNIRNARKTFLFPGKYLKISVNYLIITY